MLEFRNLTYQAGKKPLFQSASALLQSGERIGLIGRNGAGKSTLINLILGNLQEDSGEISCKIPTHDIIHLEQSLPETDLTAIEYVKTGDREWAHIQDKLTHANAAEDGMAVAECYARLQEIDGFTIDKRASIILRGLGFTEETMQQPVKQFSGGWMMRLQLARVLISRGELLLLDEPTNHLDLEAITWLENWLQKQSASIILISHDRDFLDNVCTQTLHLSQQQLRLYAGNYSAFIKQFELQLEVQAREKEKIDKQRAHMQKFVDRFRAKATKAKQAQSRLKAIEKLTYSPALQQENPFHFEFLQGEPVTSPILTLKGTAGYPAHPIIKQVNLSLMADDRIALIGLNGAGKTTLIKSLVGELPLLDGERVSHAKLKIGYYSQQQVEALVYENTPLQHILNAFPRMSESEARKYLGGFDFQGDRVFETVGRFSGGEKARLALALLILNKPNILLLDEPTNHLDIQMREALILALQSFDGAVVVVSHDAHFVNSTASTLWLIENGQIRQFDGSLSDYQQHVLDIQAEETPTPKPTPPKPTPKKQTKSFNPQKLKQLESKIETLTAELAQAEEALNDPALYQPENRDKCTQLQSNVKLLREQLAATEDEWLQRQLDTSK